MKSDLPKRTLKMMWDVSEVSKIEASKNIILSAKNNDIKLTHEDLQKLLYIVSSTIDKVYIDASKNFEGQISKLVEAELDSKSNSDLKVSKTK